MVKRVFAFASVMVVTATLVVPAFAQDAKKRLLKWSIRWAVRWRAARWLDTA